MRLTTVMLASAYDLLRATPPFDGWNLPEPEDITFNVLRTREIQGDCSLVGECYRIRLSAPWHTRLSSLLETMGHEMVHLHLDHCGAKDSSEHGRGFKRVAAEVCAVHRDFDEGSF